MIVHEANKGFTLVEAMVALAILSATLGVAFSMMLSYQEAVEIQRGEVLTVQTASRALDDMVDTLRAVRVVTHDDGEPNFMRFQIPVNPDGKGYLDENRDIRWGTTYGKQVLEGGWCAWRFVPKVENGQQVEFDETAIGYNLDLNESSAEVFILGRIQASFYESADMDAEPVGTLDLTPDIVVQVKDDPLARKLFTLDMASATIDLAVVDPQAEVPLVVELSSTVEFQNFLSDLQ